MNTALEKPKLTAEGITFFPIPEVPAMAPESAYFPRRKVPQVPSEYDDMANMLFFKGGRLPDMSPLVDRQKATQAVGRWLASYAPAHEVKTGTVAYALWLWTDHEHLSALANK